MFPENFDNWPKAQTQLDKSSNIDLKWTKMEPKWAKKLPKLDLKWIQNPHTYAQNGPKIYLKYLIDQELPKMA